MPKIEEISEEQIEVVEPGAKASDEKIKRVSADDPNLFGGENPFGKLFEGMEEFKKIRFFGPLALVLGIVGMVTNPLYFSSAALLLAALDLWKGSRLTRKISILAIILAILALLNTWN